MKKLITILFFLLTCSAFAQTTHKVSVPRGVTYIYCSDSALSVAKNLVNQELGNNPTGALSAPITFVGPVLWTRWKKNKTLSKIEGGNVTLRVDNQELSGKMTQKLEDSKHLWDVLRDEIKGQAFTLREANAQELSYYWSVISFDIEEPLIIVETKAHNYILNLNPKTNELLWLDEAPTRK